MKKFLLVASIICFSIAIVMNFICSFWCGLIMALLLGILIYADVYLIKNNPRWWIAILMFILSLLFLFWASSNLGYKTAVSELGINEAVDVIEEPEIEEELTQDIETEETDEIEPEEEQNVIIKEVPVEKVVVKEVVKEVPKVKYIEVEKKPEPTTQPTPTPTPTATPIANTSNIGYGGPTTVYGYGYGAGYGYPSGYENPGYNYNTSIKIKGPTEVYAGDSEEYTISGINSFSKSKLKLPENVSYEDHSGNKVTLYFDDDFTGGYCMIQYGTAKLKVDIIPD